MEAERIPRSQFKNVNADSHSEIILVIEEGSPATESDDPRARAACESLRFLKFPRNCNQYKQTKREMPKYKFMAVPCKCAAFAQVIIMLGTENQTNSTIEKNKQRDKEQHKIT